MAAEPPVISNLERRKREEDRITILERKAALSDELAATLNSSRDFINRMPAQGNWSTRVDAQLESIEAALARYEQGKTKRER
jgi:hypothetical protein